MRTRTLLLALAFTVLPGLLVAQTPAPAPVISSLSPGSATAGNPGFTLTLTGSNFCTDGNQVIWNTQRLTTNLTSSTTSVTAVVPASVLTTPGTAQVTLLSFCTQSTSNAVTFTINPAPTLTSLSPPGVAAGGPGFTLTLNGTNFAAGMLVVWNPAAVILSTSSFSGPNLTPLSVTPTQITVAIPSNLYSTTGTDFVQAVTSDGIGSNTLPISVYPAPTISSLLPNSVPAGSSAFLLTIAGTNFVSGDAILWNGAPLTGSAYNPSSGQLTVTVPANLVAAPGTANVVVKDPGGVVTQPALFTIIGPAVSSLVPNSAPAGTQGLTLTINGTNFLSGATVQWVVAGANPVPLTVTSATGTQIVATVPASLLTRAGTFNVAVSNPGGASASAQFAVNAPAITSLNPASATAGGQAFNLTVTGTNFVSGSIVLWNTTTLQPAQPATAQTIAVSVPASLLTTPGAVAITVQNPGGATSSAATLTITPATLAITTASLGTEAAGTPYSLTLTGNGGVPPYTWSASGLPTGFTLNASTGVLSGSSNTAGTFSIAVQLTDSRQNTTSKSFTFTVTAPPLSVQTETLPGGTVGVAYSQTVVASGGNPPYTWSVNQATLPPGLTLQASSGLISGTPTAAGTYQFGLLVTDSMNASSGRLFTVTINPPALAITTGSLVDGVAGIAYTAPALQATGGKPPYAWTLLAGTSAGFSIGPATGVITGTQSTPGPVTFVAQVTDSAGATASKTFTVNLNANLAITATVSNGTVGVAYPATQFTAAGGTQPYTWSVSAGALPAGLTLSAAGLLSGTPAAAGQFTFTVQVTDANALTASKQFQITVIAVLSVTTASLPDGSVGVPYSASLAATGGTTPYTWSAAGSLPDGVALDPAGTLSGTPSRTGTFNLTATVTDAAGHTASKPLSIQIGVALVIATTALPNGVVGSSYSASAQATGGAAPYTWTASGLPAGLTLDANTGQIGGTPTASGAASVTVTVTDSAAHSTNKVFSFNIALPAFPGINILGVPSTSNPAQQSAVSLTLNNPYPVAIDGTLTLGFTSAVGGDDQMVQFSTGGRAVNYTVPANSTQAAFSSPQGVSVITGTVAGTITVTTTLTANGTDITPVPAPTVTIVIAKSAPVITNVTVTRNATGFSVALTGYSTTRDMTQAVFQFSAAAGATLQSSTVTVPLDSVFASWYGSPASTTFGSQFTMTLPFTLQGNSSSVNGLTVTLANSIGASAPATANF